MDDRLQHLKESMDDTVMKNLDFRTKNKAEVRKSIHRPKKSNRFQQFFPRILSVGFTSILLLGIGYFALGNSGLLKTEEGQPNMADQKEPPIDAKNDRVYTPPSQAENDAEMTKDEILSKLLNSIDHFETASGSFETHTVYYDNSTSGSKVEYTISNKGIIGGYEKATSIPDKSVPGAKVNSYQMFFNDQTVWRLEDDIKSFYAMEYTPQPKRKTVNHEDVFSIPIRKIYDSPDRFRETPPVGYLHSTLFPYEFIATYLRYKDNWKIEKQNEELLGHNTIVLTGSIDKSIVDIVMQPNLHSFRLWVDKDTGILLKKEIYNIDGDIVSYLHPERLEVNIPVDSTLFVPDLADYQERILEEQTYEDSREAEIEVVEHADFVKEEVDEVVAILRKEIPFLYEFSHPDLQLYSASMERYHDLNQAYLTYSYKKPQGERGSGSQLLCVRMYHKDAVVRSLTDFDTEKGAELGHFTLNSIEWKAFEMKNNPNTHFIGTQGEFVYEVVTQEVSFNETKNLLESFRP
jgi:hypothetical protein